MSTVAIELIIALAGIVLSLLCSAFVAGMTVGQVKSDVKQLQSAATDWQQIVLDVRVMADHLARIEGMFTLRLKDGQ